MKKQQRFHINAKSEVRPCSARVKSCPFDHFSSEEAAFTVLNLREKRTSLLAARESVERIMRDPNTPRAYARVKMTHNNTDLSLRRFADQIDAEVTSTGRDPQMFSGDFDIVQDSVVGKSKNRVNLRRIPAADFDNGVISGQWYLTVTSTRNHNDSVEITLDFGNYDEAMTQVRNALREAVAENATTADAVERIDADVEDMADKVSHAYLTMEAEASGEYSIYERFYGRGVGSFANSDALKLSVNVDYESSLFRLRSVERFMEANPYYENFNPEMDVLVFDNEATRSDAWWSIYRSDDGWTLTRATSSNAQPLDVKVESAEQASALVEEFVSLNMPTKRRAAEKGAYVANLMNGIDEYLGFRTEHNRAYGELERARVAEEHQRSTYETLYGRKSESKFNKVLSLFS